MENNHTTMSDLFQQLGLASDEKSVDAFIHQHSGLAQRVHIEDAPFWSPQQAEFIANALAEDAEWAELIDQLNVLLH
ncbi:MAG: hypothetical protein ACI8Z9_000664 [Paraglaciecola sp.]|jgi:hypothetical protein